MRHNGRAPLLASKMSPNMLSLHAGEPPMVACPDCTSWRVVRRSMLQPHRAADKITRCPGSAQRIVIDLTAVEWQTRLAIACREAGLRRGSRTEFTPRPPTPTPIHRIAA